MSAVIDEISALEEQLRLAELAPDPTFFESVLADDAVIISENGEPSQAKSHIVEAHRPGKGPKFAEVKINHLKIVDHGIAAVVTCQGHFEGSEKSITLRFMRVWLKKNDRWQIVAGSISK
jgi:ketosteroid isomerase-like protein